MSCNKRKLNRLILCPQVHQAVQFLNDLGSVQHFTTERLKSRVVINPQWIVDVMACVVSVKNSPIQVRPKKKSCVSGNPTLPIGTGRPLTFFFENTVFFFVGLFIIEFSIYIKKSRPYLKFFFAVNTIFFFGLSHALDL